MPKSEKFQQLPAPWDRIFSAGTRLFVWVLLAAVLYLLRSFLLLIFLTFVFSYIQSHCVDGLGHRITRRVYRVILVGVVFLGVIVGTVYFLTPHVKDQARQFITNWPKYKTAADKAIYTWVDEYPTLRRLVEPDEELHTPRTDRHDEIEEPRKDGQDPAPHKPRPEILQPLVNDVLGLSAKDKGDFRVALATYLKTATSILGVTSSFLLSLLFSFLIVLDLPKLQQSVAGLAQTRLDFIYEEVSDTIRDFGKVLGRALEAQLFIAICNTILTAIGILLMGLENVVFLATIVFFCSFIPVAGVFISSAPICLMALQSGGENVSGVQMMMLAIALITLIHMIEAYYLNPMIFGHHLRMNAVMVLIVLTIGGKLFGIWGLILGLPMVNYIFGTAIRRAKDERKGQVAA